MLLRYLPGIFAWALLTIALPSASANTLVSPTIGQSGFFTNPSYYSTIRLADINGDGKQDLCARYANGIHCFLNNGSAFTTEITVPALSDAAGYGQESHYSTLQFVDINGDQKADLCGRRTSGIFCRTSTGTGFSTTEITFAAFTDASGFNLPKLYKTVRFADVDGDGKTDVCARRASSTFVCHLSLGTSFRTTAIVGPNWSDAAGWSDPSLYETIGLADVTGDGKADVCSRVPGTAAGVRCYASTGITNFSTTAISATTNFRDSDGFKTNASHYQTIQYVDIDADNRADVCGRSDTFGLRCYRSLGTSFAATPTLSAPGFVDAVGWSHPSHYQSINFVDADADGSVDLCFRDGTWGTNCLKRDLVTKTFPSTNSIVKFAAFNNLNGFTQNGYFETIRYAKTLDSVRDLKADVCGRDTTTTSARIICSSLLGSYPVAVKTITVTPPSAPLVLGQTVQMKAIALDAAGKQLTGVTFAWSSTNTAVATVSSTGLVTSKAAGTATIRAVASGVTGSSAVKVQPVIASLTLRPLWTIAPGMTFNIKALIEAKTATGAVVPTSALSFTFLSSNPSAVSINANGDVAGVTVGQSTLTVSSGGVITTGVSVVKPPNQVVKTIYWGSAPANWAVGQTFLLQNQIEDALGSKFFQSNSPSNFVWTWTSSNTSVFRVNSQGYLTAVGAGTAILHLTINDATSSNSFTVLGTAPLPARIVVSPNSLSVTKGTTSQVSVAYYPQGSTTPQLGVPINILSSDPSIATVQSVSTTGTATVTGVATGNTHITASYAGTNAISDISVIPPSPAQIIVSPSLLHFVALGTTQPLTANYYPVGSSTPQPATFTWNSLNTTIATVNSSGVVTAIGNGLTLITVTAFGVSSSASASVQSSGTTSPARIVVSPSSFSLSQTGQTQQLLATYYPANSSNPAPATFSWSSNLPSVATVGATTGLVTAVANGSATLTASANGITGTSSGTVSTTPLPTGGRLVITPQNFSFPAGSTQQLQASFYPSGSTTPQNVTTSVTWASSSVGTASVNSQGLLTTTVRGAVKITATYNGLTTYTFIRIVPSGVAVPPVCKAPTTSTDFSDLTRA